MIGGSGKGGEAQKHTDPTDPDPQHCFKACLSFSNETQYFTYVIIN
jgi:hypothetical protein